MGERVVHCWQGKLDHLQETQGWEAYLEARYVLGEPDGTCMLLQGHEGPHVWTPDDEIGVTFEDDDE